MPAKPEPRVALFVTCLVDLFRPTVGFAAVRLLEAAGCRVEVPRGQTCCGQPAYNQGDRADTIAIARRTIEAFAGYDYVVAPSGSCAGMLKKHYPELFAPGSADAERARDLAERTFELTGFLVDVLGVGSSAVELPVRATYHDSCSSLRELGVRNQPRQLLAGVAGLELAELAGQPRSAAASAAPSASNIRRSRPRWSTTRWRRSRRPGPSSCSRATSAA